jgi:hypothetical protein
MAPPRGALAGAFTSNVQDAPTGGTPAAPADLSVTEEWYVAINGVPVGPVRISELRRRAAKGDVTEESLCWQEGLEEWRPIRSIPELAALVREAAQGNRPLATESVRPSVAPPRPPAAPMTSRTPPPAPRPAGGSLAPTPARSNVVPLRPAASASFDDHGSFGGAQAATATAAAPAAPMTMATPAAVADPFAVPPPAPFPTPAVAPSVAPPAPYPTQRSGVPVWFVIVVILLFGSGIGVLLFRSQPAPAPVVIQMPPTALATPTAPAATSTDTPTATPAADTAASVAVEMKGKSGPVAAKVTGAKAADTAERKGLDLGNLVNGAGGPTTGPNTSPGAGSGGGLDQAGVERVVAGHRAGVKRTCWERGGADQKSSVNVTITANVAPNGSVASTSSSGDDPVVAKCIENQVRTWTFPAPGSNTTINIPFKFVRQ